MSLNSNLRPNLGLDTHPNLDVHPSNSSPGDGPSLAALFRRATVVDLSVVLRPGRESRRLEIRRFRLPVGEFAYDIDTMSHIGTHVEVPCHFLTALDGRVAKDITGYPPDRWWGEAVFVDLRGLRTGEAVTPRMLEVAGVKPGDIVIMGNSSCGQGEGENYLSAAAARWMGETGIKLLGTDTSFRIEEKSDRLENMATHVELMSRDIPIIEVLANLDRLTTRRFFFLGIPVLISEVDAFPIRALALEGV